MSKQVWSVLAAIALTLALAAVALGQTVETTTTQKKVVQNPDGTYTIIEYPVKKEVTLTLNPVNITGATGVATILRDDDGTRIKLNLANVPADVTALTLYAVDEKGVVTALGPVAIANGTGTLAATTPLSRFMLIASPEAALTAYDPNTRIVFRSAVPEGFAVIPMTRSASGETVSATAAPTTPVTVAPAAAPQVAAVTYTAPMLGIPTFKKGDDTKLKVNFTDTMAGARANIFIEPRKNDTTTVKVRFHDLKEAPSGMAYILWAVSPDGQFQNLGSVVNLKDKHEAEVNAAVAYPDFGLFITTEPVAADLRTIIKPAGSRVGFIEIVP